MNKALQIAAREFLNTVSTRGFILGLLMLPLMLVLVSLTIPRLMNQKSPRVYGEVAIVDPTGVVTAELKATIAAAAVLQRRIENQRRVLARSQEALGLPKPASTAPVQEPKIEDVPNLRVVAEAAQPDLQRVQSWLRGSGERRRVAFVVIHSDAVRTTGQNMERGTYDLYVPAKLDERTENVIHDSVREALINARARAEGLDRLQLDGLVRVARPTAVVVLENQQTMRRGADRVVPLVLLGLLMFAVMMGGGSLLTTTVEEKSNRVMEVLLSAVSPLQLMAGKIIGQMAVSGVVLALYLALGGLVLLSLAQFGLIDPLLLLYLLIFFVLSYLIIGSLMAAAGVAVTDIRDAQALLTPLSLVIMMSWLFAIPVSNNPNTVFSTVISFIPPINGFAMLMRLASSAPPPTWQVWLSIAISTAAAVLAIQFAAKSFRIALLLHGKPPNLITLIRWVRAA